MNKRWDKKNLSRDHYRSDEDPTEETTSREFHSGYWKRGKRRQSDYIDNIDESKKDAVGNSLRKLGYVPRARENAKTHFTWQMKGFKKYLFRCFKGIHYHPEEGIQAGKQRNNQNGIRNCVKCTVAG